MNKIKGLIIGDSPYPDQSQVLTYEDGTSVAFAVNPKSKNVPSSYRNLNKLYEKTFGQNIPDCTFSNWIKDGYLFLNWSDNRDYIQILCQISDIPTWCMCAKAAKSLSETCKLIHTPHPSGANPRFHKWLKSMMVSESPFLYLALHDPSY